MQVMYSVLWVSDYLTLYMHVEKAPIRKEVISQNSLLFALRFQVCVKVLHLDLMEDAADQARKIKGGMHVRDPSKNRMNHLHKKNRVLLSEKMIPL